MWYHSSLINSSVPKKLKYRFNKSELYFTRELAKIEKDNETIVDIVELYSFGGYLVTSLYINGEKYFLERRGSEVIDQIKEEI